MDSREREAFENQRDAAELSLEDQVTYWREKYLEAACEDLERVLCNT